VKPELQNVEIPGEYEARRRTWEVVRAAYAERERIAWPRRHARSLVLAAAAVAVVAAAVTPPGRSVVDSVRRTIGVEHAQRELFRLPAPGRLLVQSERGAWVVQPDGSRRLLGRYRDASWSPRGKFVAAILDGRTLVALEPNGTVHWEKPQRVRLASPRWSYEGYRIAYLAGSRLRVINGDGTGDRLIGAADPAVAPAWRPRTHELAYVAHGVTKVVDVDSGKALRPRAADSARLHAAVRPGGGPTARIESRRGRSVVLVGKRQVFSGAGRFGSVAWSPDGRWLAVGWPSADQLVFVRIGGMPKLVAFSDAARQFGSAPSIAGWAR
jgi:WD40-like Beta Propeller Repeat